MSSFISFLIGGISLGSIYALIALGYTMVYGIAKMLNFAHGDVIMIGGYVSWLVLSSLGLPVWLAVLCAILVCVILGVVIEKVAYKPLRTATPLAVLITAIGVSYLLQNVALLTFGPASKTYDSVVPDGLKLKVGSVDITGETIVTIAVTVVIMICLTLFVNHTKSGKAMLAVSEDKGAAQLMGINVNNIIMITFAIGSALASLASVFFLLKAPTMTPTLGALPGIKAFTAAVIGGIGSIPGAMIGGLLLGVIECFAQAVPAIAPYTVAIEFAILIIILLVKPTGLLGKKRREKV